MRGKFEHLGTVSCPSGTLLDGGAVWLWLHDRPPIIRGFPGIVGAAESARDLAIRGPYALAAGRAFQQSGNPFFVFDRSEDELPRLRSAFETTMSTHGFEASIEILEERVPHRRRLDLSLDVGGGLGVVDFHGMTAIAIAGLPCDLPLSISGERMPKGLDADLWRRVSIQLRDGETASQRRIGHVTVDEARLMTVDADVLGLWDDRTSSDGKADVVFWGRDALEVARKAGAEAIADGNGGDTFGWLDTPIDDAHARAVEMLALRSDEQRFAVDFRPHTH